MVVYHDMDGRLGSVQGAPVNVESCFTYSGSRIGSPTFNADGTRGWWATADGLVTAPFAMTSGAGGCGTAVNAASVVAGARSPDWGPADVPTSRPAAPAPAPAPAPRPVPAPAPPTRTTRSLKFTMQEGRAAQGAEVRARPDRPRDGQGDGDRDGRHEQGGVGLDQDHQLTLRFTAKAKKSLARKRRVIVKIAVTRGAQHATTATTLAR